MRRTSLALLTIALSACGGGDVTPPAEGPLNLDIVEGQDQVAPAGVTQLSAPVVGQLVRIRTADGRWRFRFELVKTAYAQTTVVNGSPVVGAVVCSETVAGNFKPFSVCTNTDATGKATFFYQPGTKAGTQRAEIRGLNAAGQPAVFDTVRATVEPGPVDANLFLSSAGCTQVTSREVADTAAVDVYKNKLVYRIEGDSVIAVAGAVAGTVEARTISYAAWRVSLGNNPPQNNTTSRTGLLRVLDANGVQIARLMYGVRTASSLGWEMYGMSRSLPAAGYAVC